MHWNVVGPHFIAVHEMIDPHVEEVRAMVDETAERIATLGLAPIGTPGAIVEHRSWDDYSLDRGTTNEHLGALDAVYNGLLSTHRKAQEAVGEIDAVSEDMLIGQIKQLELFHWFVRAHLETVGGELSTGKGLRRARRRPGGRRPGRRRHLTVGPTRTEWGTARLRPGSAPAAPSPASAA